LYCRREEGRREREISRVEGRWVVGGDEARAYRGEEDIEKLDRLIARVLSHQSVQCEAIERKNVSKNTLPLEKRAKRATDKIEKNWFLGDKRLYATFFRFRLLGHVTSLDLYRYYRFLHWL
jgi:hypothetical protein